MQNRLGIAIAAVAIVMAGTSLVFSAGRRTRPTTAFDTPYQAVLLTGGLTYYGKLSGLGTAFPTLSDVYYVQNQTNPETKQVSSILVKRGKEWHAPNRMYLNASQIILVEPVSPGSKVAQLIAESKTK